MIQRPLKEFHSGLRLLERSYPYFREPETTAKGMEVLSKGLRWRRSKWGKEAWQYFCEQICSSHPIRQLLHQDPVTFRSFSKPRGYAGDAVLLDLLYRHPSVDEKVRNATSIGKAIYEYHLSSPSAESVRWRRRLLSRLLNETIARAPDAEILSVACGHLREAALSQAVRNNQIKRLVAFDQDEMSLRTVKREKNGSNIECVQGTVKDLIRRKIKIGKFDFIYSAGLYDYLNDAAANVLTRTLFGMLKDEGRLLIANFLPGNKECGYMEAFMGWKLLYRSRAQFERMVGPIRKYIQKIFFDDNRYVIYLEFRKS